MTKEKACAELEELEELEERLSTPLSPAKTDRGQEEEVGGSARFKTKPPETEVP
jgi:hypothetical protein